MKPIVLTRHAETVAVERGLEREWIERTVRQPAVLEPDPARPGVKRAFRAVPEREGRVLRVAFVDEADEIRVLTAFLDRSRSR